MASANVVPDQVAVKRITPMANAATASLPSVLVPGLNCSPRLYAEQIPALWRFGSVLIADHTRDDTIAAIARRILAEAPPRFALAGHSMGGYIAFEMTRQAPERVAKLALLDTGPRPETLEQTARRHPRIELAKAGRMTEVADVQFPLLVHPSRQGDRTLRNQARSMAEETGSAAFLRQQQATISRLDSRPGLSAIACPTLVLVGDSDQVAPPALSQEMAAAISGARLVVVPDCGHLSTLERPQAVTQALVEWMSA
jgi:pimeloyl-ACP methyl ester carboxylesterase